MPMQWHPNGEFATIDCLSIKQLLINRDGWKDTLICIFFRHFSGKSHNIWAEFGLKLFAMARLVKDETAIMTTSFTSTNKWLQFIISSRKHGLSSKKAKTAPKVLVRTDKHFFFLDMTTCCLFLTCQCYISQFLAFLKKKPLKSRTEE